MIYIVGKCTEHPPTVANASASDLQNIDPPQYNYGHVITYTCDEGYEVTSGHTQITCAEGIGWFGTPPVCSGKW